MSADELQGYLRVRPFQPLRIIVSDGTRHEVRHSDQAAPLAWAVKVACFAPENVQPVEDFVVTVSYFHIVRLEPILPKSSNQETDGAA